jgi:hypothetical protein
MIQKIVISLLIGFLMTLWIAQEDPWVTKKFEYLFKTLFASSLDCSFSSHVKRVNFFVPSIELEDVQVSPLKGNGWMWKAKKYNTKCTWASILGVRKLDLHITMEGLEATTTMDSNNQPAIMAHLKRVIAISSGNLPITLKELCINKGKALLDDSAIQGSICWTSRMLKGAQELQLDCTVHDGAVVVHDKHVKHMHGDIHLINQTANQQSQLAADGSISLQTSLLPEPGDSCSITIAWNNDRGAIVLKNNNNLLCIDPISITYADNTIKATATAQVPLNYLAHMAGIRQGASIQGNSTAHVELAINDKLCLDGTYTIGALYYNSIKLIESCALSFKKNDENWHGEIQIIPKIGQSIVGLYSYDQIKNTYTFSASNDTPLMVPLVSALIDAGNAQICVQGTWQKGQGNYSCIIANQTADLNQTITGAIDIHPAGITINACNNDKEARLSLGFKPFELQTLYYGKKDKNPLIHMKNDHQTHALVGYCDFSLVRQALVKLCNTDIQGHGTIGFTMTNNDHEIQTHLTMTEGTIRLPHTYNFITGFQGTVLADLTQKKCVVRNLNCTLHRGSITCDRATVLLNDAFDFTFAHIPLLADSCLININRDLFAQVSAFLLVTKTEGMMPLCKGNLLIERGNCKDNIFAHVVPQRVSPVKPTPAFMNCECDLSVATREPIQIQTPFLQTNVRLNAHVSGALDQPKVKGAITISGGCLNFPYKPLFISKGRITFQQNQLSDPLIELSAHNSMRNYRVSLQVAGSGSNPLINLTSTPTLSEEQIIALLLTGQPEGSLNMVMPSLVMQNIKNLLFDARQDSPNSYFAGFLKPLRHIKVIPRFSDQTARGGIRGALEIELGERWHATIQNNFSLSEDTRLDVEYLASDNIAVRGFRSEQRDVGGEVEMRWKW